MMAAMLVVAVAAAVVTVPVAVVVDSQRKLHPDRGHKRRKAKRESLEQEVDEARAVRRKVRRVVPPDLVP